MHLPGQLSMEVTEYGSFLGILLQARKANKVHGEKEEEKEKQGP